MAASRFKYNTWQLGWGEFSLAQWLWYWLFVQASLVQILSRSCISAMHLFICVFVMDFVRKTCNINWLTAWCLPLFSTLSQLYLNPFPNNDTFWCPRERSLLKTLWEKEKLLVTSNFSFTHCVFYLLKDLSAIFIKFKIVVGRLFQFGSV